VAAAAVPEAFITAHDALLTQAQLAAGENLLIHAIGSGVGLAAAQLGRALGAKVYGSSRAQEKLDRAREFGMIDGVTLGKDLSLLAEKAKSWTGGRGMDVVLDLVGGPYVPASIECMATRSRLLLVGTVAGGRAEITLGQVMSRRMKIIGTVLRSRSLEEKIAATEAFAREVVPLLATEKICPVLDSAFRFAEVQAAHRRVESNETFGKVVLRMD
jgi:NADPH:quinone reductase-like Zn-dependent oxidoreductase